MVNEGLLFAGAGLTGLWGIVQLFAAAGVVVGPRDVLGDDRRVATAEWVMEGVALISTAASVAVVAALDSGSAIASGVFAVAVSTLVVLALVSLLAGFHTCPLPYRPCPLVFTLSAVVIALGAWL